MAASFNWGWTDERFSTIENASFARSKAHWLAGGRASWFSQDENLEVALWGKNLCDRK